MNFKSKSQHTSFRQVVAGLEAAGYVRGLLIENYSYTDFLEADSPTRVLPAGAFGRTPPSFDTACVSVVLAAENERSGIINSCRAFGAPVAFEVDDTVVRQWRVSADGPTLWKVIPADDVKRRVCSECRRLVTRQHSQSEEHLTNAQAPSVGLHRHRVAPSA